MQEYDNTMSHHYLKKQAKKLLIFYGASPNDVKYEVEYTLPNNKKFTVDVAGHTKYGSTVVECGKIGNDRLSILTRLFDKVIWIPFGVEVILNEEKTEGIIQYIDQLEEDNKKLRTKLEKRELEIKGLKSLLPNSDLLERLEVDLESILDALTQNRRAYRKPY